LAGISWKPHCSRPTLSLPRSQANWAEVVQLYDALFALAGSPVVAINRALALAELHGASAGLAAMQEVAADARLAEYQAYWAARAELLAKSGAHGDASEAYEIAIGLERDASVRSFLQQRQSTLPRRRSALCIARPYGGSGTDNMTRLAHLGVPVPPRTSGKALARFASA
jgi:hypothetical protein